MGLQLADAHEGTLERRPLGGASSLRRSVMITWTQAPLVPLGAVTVSVPVPPAFQSAAHELAPEREAE